MAATMIARSFDDAFRYVQKLLKNFEIGKRHYLSGDCSERDVRDDLIDHLFMGLGWDPKHLLQTNPFEQEVKVENKVLMAGRQRRADYAFHIAPQFQDVRFIVEAKRAAHEITNADDYFQAIRYGRYKKNRIAVLTNFVQLHLLDCRYKHDIETALLRSVKSFTYQDLGDRDHFAELYWLLSHEAVEAGFLDKFADALPKPRAGSRQLKVFPGGFQTIDDSFLQELDELRLILARAFRKANSELDSRTLTEITQRTLDRLVFMRFLEDKEIEPDPFVATFGTGGIQPMRTLLPSVGAST
jgi:hypothetical protein